MVTKEGRGSGTMQEVSNRSDLAIFAEKYRLDEKFPDRAMERMKLVRVEKGEFLCLPGRTLHNLALLVSGKLKISKTLSNGKSLLLRFNQPLSVIGDVELVTGRPVTTYVEAMTESFVVTVDFSALREECMEDISFLTFLLQAVSSKLYTSSNSTSINMLATVNVRLASYLLSNSGSDVSEELYTPKLTDLAELLGTSYRHLNRVIRDFCDADLIERGNGRFLIKDRNRLQGLANGNIYE